jgi:membrane protein YdbS with pleckstrin-like domain
MTSLEDQLWNHPSEGLWRMRRAEVTVVTVVAACVVGSFLSSVGGSAAIAGAVGMIVLGAVVSLFVRRRYRAWRYKERHEDLLVGRGVLVQRLSVVPYGRMQFVEVTAGPVERVFNLSTVKLHTAAAASDARIPGLQPEEAARLRDRLTQLGEANAAGM